MIPSFSKAKAAVSRVTSMQQLDDLKARCKDKMVAILFWAIWYPECEEMRKEFEKLAEHLSHIRLFWCDVDNDKEIIDTYEVYKVPYILLMHVSIFSVFAQIFSHHSPIKKRLNLLRTQSHQHWAKS